MHKNPTRCARLPPLCGAGCRPHYKSAPLGAGTSYCANCTTFQVVHCLSIVMIIGFNLILNSPTSEWISPTFEFCSPSFEEAKKESEASL